MADSDKKLSFGQKTGYGVAEIGMSAVELALQVYLLELYVLAGLNPFWAGLALAIAVLWDAVSDPLMGHISDMTSRSARLGNRIPYMIAGSILLGFSFYMLFSPGADSGNLSLFFQLLFWYLIVNTALTLLGVPHLALVNDIGKNESDRVALFGSRLILGALGLLCALIVPVIIAKAMSQESIDEDISALLENREFSAAAIGFLAVVTGLVTCWLVWKVLKKQPKAVKKTTGSLLDGAKTVLRSRALVLIIVGFSLIAIGRAFNSSLALIFYKSSLGFTEGQVSQMLLALTIVIMLSAGIWIQLSKRFDKGSLSIIALISLTAVTAVSYPLLPKYQFAPVMIVVVLGGFMVASIVLLEAMFSDLVESQGGEGASDFNGVFYGVWRMATKVARAGGILCSGWFLAAVGYEKATAEQSHFVERSVAYAFGPGVALFFGVGCWFVYKSTLVKRKVQ